MQVPVEQMDRREGSGERRRSMPLLHSSTMCRTGLAHMALVDVDQTDNATEHPLGKEMAVYEVNVVNKDKA